MVTVKYKTNYLKEVIVRIDLALPLSTLKDPMDIELFNQIIENFQILGQSNIVNLGNRNITEWIFYGKNREKYLKISQDYLIIDYKVYKNFEQLKDEFLSVVNLILRKEPELQIKRFGLRYKNEIKINRGKPINWGEFINSNLLSIFKIAKNKEEISRAFSNLSLNFNNMILTFQYGMHNPDFPSIIKKKIFILDFDAYTDNIIKGIKEIESFLVEFHNKIYEMFEYSIEDKLRKEMNK